MYLIFQSKVASTHIVVLNLTMLFNQISPKTLKFQATLLKKRDRIWRFCPKGTGTWRLPAGPLLDGWQS